MSDMEGSMSLRSLLEALPNSENAQETLINIRTALSVIPPSALRDVAPQLSFNSLFDFLRTGDSDQTEICCDILDKLLAAVDISAVLSSFHNELLTGLSEGSYPVKILCLKQICRAAEDDSSQLLNVTDLINAVVISISDESVDISQKAVAICTKLGGVTDGRNTLLKNNQVSTSIQESMQKGDVIRFRIYEMLVSIAVQSLTALEIAADTGLTRLFGELHETDDILLRLNCLELLTTLAQCEHGLQYMEQHAVLVYMETVLNSLEQDPFGSLLLPGIIKFFGRVCSVRAQEISGRFRRVFLNLVNFLEEGPTSSLTPISVETLGFVGRSVAGKRELAKLGDDTMTRCFKQLGSFMKESSTELKVTSIETIGQLMTVDDEEISNDIASLTEQWFSGLTPSSPSDPQPPLKRVLEFCKQPFTEIRLASLQLLRSLIRLRWAQTLLHVEPGFDEYLLDRSTEVTKEGLELKYGVVRALVGSSSVAEVFGNEYLLRLKMYERDGAFYVSRETHVAMDNE